ncbi:MAG TPA: TIM barrel protein [Gemmataceae bacterium]|nr:TIM barrel protein [Gemmataceae bacterium]
MRLLPTLGFSHVDLVALVERPPAHLEALAASGLIVSCGAIGRQLPEDTTLDAAAVPLRRAALEQVERQILDIARLGGTCAYVVPGKDTTFPALARFSEACALLADYAAGCGVRLCIEHSPRTALPTAAATLGLLERIGHANLGLLLDLGHCLLSREDPAGVVSAAGRRVFYVHLDDNDGVSDLHWPLLTGRLSEEMLRGMLAALSEQKYAGGLALELRAENAEPAEALRRGRELVVGILKGIWAQ